jgi:hypothetical protein
VSVPRVTVKCYCGNTLLIAYGADETCACGRGWDTAQIPAADFAALRATLRRFRRNEAAFAMVALAVAAALILVGRSAPVYVTLPVFAIAWFRWFRPWWRLRKQGRLRDLPTWTLTPHGGPKPGTAD